MKRIIIGTFAAFISLFLSAQPYSVQITEKAPSLDYFLPAGASSFNPDVPTPESVLGFNFSERFPEWSDVVSYMKALAASSERVSIKFFGKTFEERPYVQVCITSPSNQKRLDEIRDNHISISDLSKDFDPTSQLLVIDLMGSIHGNEISGVTGLLPVAYYYAACNDQEAMETLEKAVIVITPGLNPDGMNRFANWINSSASRNHYLNSDSFEYRETQPSSRTNHYWMDCNRDWLAARFDIGRNCVEMYKYWMPNVVLDLHEMGNKAKNGPYYFSPGDPNRTYKYTPERNQELTELISRSTSAALDGIKSKYFSKTGYDDYFIGKGAAYCDIQGGIGILHEQSSTRGHMEILKGKAYCDTTSFAMTVRNQSISSFGVVRGAMGLRKELLEYQRQFYMDAAKAAGSEGNAGYVFGLKNDRGRTYEFISNLRLHEIEVYKVKGEEGRYAVPLNQKHYYLTKCIFEDITEFSDSTFYDISTWSQSRAYDLNAILSANLPELGDKIEKAEFIAGSVETTPETSAYVFSTSEYYAPYMMSFLQNKGIKLKVALDAFSFKSKSQRKKISYPAGTLLVSVKEQSLSAEALVSELKASASLCGVDVKSLKEKEISLEALKLSDVREPNVAIIGSGYEQGTFWYLLDRRFGIRHAVLKAETILNKDFDFSKYTTIILTAPAPQSCRRALAEWVKNGGTLFLKDAAISTTFGKAFALPEIKYEEHISKKKIKGVVLRADIKKSDSPLLWGYDCASFDLMNKDGGSWVVPEGYETILGWSEKPYLSGCISQSDLARIASKPVIITKKLEKGAIIFCQVDLNYRSYWLSTSHLISNSIFFGDKL